MKGDSFFFATGDSIVSNNLVLNLYKHVNSPEARVYLSRPGLPIINQTVLGYADLLVRGQAWRAYGLQTADGVIQIAQPARVREALARAAAERVVIPLVLLLPIMIAAVAWIVVLAAAVGAAGASRRLPPCGYEPQMKSTRPRTA